MNVTFFERQPNFTKSQIEGETTSTSREFQIWDILQNSDAITPLPHKSVYVPDPVPTSHENIEYPVPEPEPIPESSPRT